MSKIIESEEYIEFLEKFLIENFEPLSKDFLNLCKKGKASLNISVSGLRISLPDYIENVFYDKYNINANELKLYIKLLALFAYYKLSDNKEIYNEFYKIFKNENKEDTFIKINNSVSNILNEYPMIEERYYLMTLCKTYFLDDIEWDLILKKGSSDMEDKYKKDIPIGLIKLTFQNENTILSKNPIIVNFETSFQDINIIISNLSELRDKLKQVI